MKTKTNRVLIVIIILLAVVIVFKLLNKNKEHFIEMFESISSYDNVDLVKNRKGNHKWRKPHNKNLVLEKEIHTSHGVSNSINSLEERDGKLIDYNVPSVDGLQNSKYVKVVFYSNTINVVQIAVPQLTHVMVDAFVLQNNKENLLLEEVNY